MGTASISTHEKLTRLVNQRALKRTTPLFTHKRAMMLDDQRVFKGAASLFNHKRMKRLGKLESLQEDCFPLHPWESDKVKQIRVFKGIASLLTHIRVTRLKKSEQPCKSQPSFAWI